MHKSAHAHKDTCGIFHDVIIRRGNRAFKVCAKWNVILNVGFASPSQRICSKNCKTCAVDMTPLVWMFIGQHVCWGVNFYHPSLEDVISKYWLLSLYLCYMAGRGFLCTKLIFWGADKLWLRGWKLIWSERKVCVCLQIMSSSSSTGCPFIYTLPNVDVYHLHWTFSYAATVFFICAMWMCVCALVII